MLGWTVLLFWAQLKPIERADILLITLFPVVTLLAIAGVLVAKSNQISISNLVAMFVFVFCSLLCVHTVVRLGKKTKTQPLAS